MALAGTLDTRRGGLLQRTPQVIRLDTRSDTLSLMFLDIAAKEPGCPSLRRYALSREIRSFSGIATVSSLGAELPALPDVPTDGSIFISASTTIGIVPAMPSSSIHSSPAGLPDQTLDGLPNLISLSSHSLHVSPALDFERWDRIRIADNSESGADNCPVSRQLSRNRTRRPSPPF